MHIKYMVLCLRGSSQALLCIILDEVKSAERVLVDEIPLPDLPVSAPVAPYDIPLPQPKSILKKAAAQNLSSE